MRPLLAAASLLLASCAAAKATWYGRSDTKAAAIPPPATTGEGLNPNLHATVRTGSPYAGRLAAQACGIDFHNEVNWYTFEDGAWDASQALLRVVRRSAFATETAAGLIGYEREGLPADLRSAKHANDRVVFSFDPATGGMLPTDLPLRPCLAALLQAGADLQHRNRLEGESALDLAVRADDAWMVGCLLNMGADPQKRDVRGLTALHYAAHGNHIHALQALVHHPNTAIDAGIRPQRVNALMIAAQAGHAEAVAALLVAGADPNAVDKGGVTALGKAAVLGHVDIVRRLAEAGADPFALDKNGASPLVACVKQNATEGIRVLLDLGADVHAPILADGATILMYAVSLPASRPVIATLLAAGADPNAVTRSGATPMSVAVRTCSSSIVMDIHKAGGNVETKVGGKTLLVLACESGRAGGVASLLALGADPNQVADAKWLTRPLHVAAMAGHLPTVKVLLKAGARLHDADHAKHTALHWAAYSGHADVAGYLLRRGLDANAVNSDQLTALMLAAQQGHADVITALAEAGANLDVREARRQRPPLLMAAGRGKLDAVRALLDAGADINATDSRLWTALSLAAVKNDRNMTLLLLQRGASVKAYYPLDTGLLPEDMQLSDAAVPGLPPGAGVVPEDAVDSHLCLSLTLRAAHWDKSPEGRAAHERAVAEAHERHMEPEEAAVSRKAREAKDRRRSAKRKSKKGKKGKKGKRSKKGKKESKRRLKHPGEHSPELEYPPTPWDVAVPVCLAAFGAPRETLPEVADTLCGFKGDLRRPASPSCGVNSIRIPAASVLVNPGGVWPKVADEIATQLVFFTRRYFADHQHHRPPVVQGVESILDTQEILNARGISLDHLVDKSLEEVNEILNGPAAASVTAGFQAGSEAGGGDTRHAKADSGADSEQRTGAKHSAGDQAQAPGEGDAFAAAAATLGSFTSASEDRAPVSGSSHRAGHPGARAGDTDTSGQDEMEQEFEELLG